MKTTVEELAARIEATLTALSVEGGPTLTGDQAADLVNLLASLQKNKRAKTELAKNMIE